MKPSILLAETAYNTLTHKLVTLPRKDSVPITKRSWFILFGEISVISYDNYKKHRKLPEPFHPNECEDQVVTFSAVTSFVLVGI